MHLLAPYYNSVHLLYAMCVSVCVMHTSGSIWSEVSSWGSVIESVQRRPDSQTYSTSRRTCKKGEHKTLMQLLQWCNDGTPAVSDVYIERIGATESREAIRIPLSQMQAVRSRAQVGSPFALPWPNTCNTHTHTPRYKNMPPMQTL